MTKIIYKYPLSAGSGQQTIYLPDNAQLLSVQEQGGVPALWALLDFSKPNSSRFINCYGAGNQINDNPGFFLGTVQIGGLVWHYFERN